MGFFASSKSTGFSIPKKQKNLSVGFPGFPKITLQKPTPPIAAAVFSGLAAEELPGTDDLEEVNESNGSELFLTRVPEDAGQLKQLMVSNDDETYRVPFFFLVDSMRSYDTPTFEDLENWKNSLSEVPSSS